MRDKPKPATGESVNVHIEHYFPKGYDPGTEPWKSIRKHHNAALAAEREKVEQLEVMYARLFADQARENQASRTVHEVFCVGIRKALKITSPVPISDILDVAIAMTSQVSQLRDETRLYVKVGRQLAAAQAAIFAIRDNFRPSLAFRREHERKCAAEAQQPLVDALKGMIYAFHEEARVIEDVAKQERALEASRAALAKVKEGK